MKIDISSISTDQLLEHRSWLRVFKSAGEGVIDHLMMQDPPDQMSLMAALGQQGTVVPAVEVAIALLDRELAARGATDRIPPDDSKAPSG